MSHADVASQLPFAAELPTTVAADVPCRKCRYNLRGLSTDSRCPECGTPVGFSVRGDFLRYSDPAWVDTLRRGVKLILWYVVLAIGVALFTALAKRGLGLSTGESATVTLVASLGAYAVYIAGAWFLTEPDPSGLGEDRYGTVRKLIRVTLLIGVGQYAVNLATEFDHQPPAVSLVLAVVGGLAGIASLVGTFATFVYLGRLAARIPDLDAVRRCRTLIWGFGLPLAVVVVVGALVVIVTVAGGGPSPAAAAPLLAAGCLFAVCGVVLLIYGLLYLRLLSNLGKRFAEQAALARETWAAPASPTAGPGGATT